LVYLEFTVGNTSGLVFLNTRINRILGIRMWRMVHALFASKKTVPARVSIVALVVSEQDREVLGGFGADVRFAESCEEAGALSERLRAPIVLFDRDWPGTEWRTAVANLASSPHGACVVLLSGVSDDYLRQEVIRMGGYDVLPKPLRAENVQRAVKLALSYWNSRDHTLSHRV
jgi:FixJ family two-component response regulator